MAGGKGFDEAHASAIFGILVVACIGVFIWSFKALKAGWLLKTLVRWQQESRLLGDLAEWLLDRKNAVTLDHVTDLYCAGVAGKLTLVVVALGAVLFCAVLFFFFGITAKHRKMRRDMRAKASFAMVFGSPPRSGY